MSSNTDDPNEGQGNPAEDASSSGSAPSVCSSCHSEVPEERMNITAQGLVCDDCTAAADLAGLENTIGEGKKKTLHVGLAVGGVLLGLSLLFMANLAGAHTEEEWKEGLPTTLHHLCVLGKKGNRSRIRDGSSREPSELEPLADRSETLFDGVGQEIFLMRRPLTTGPVPWAICSPGRDGDEETGDDICIGDWAPGDPFQEVGAAQFSGYSNVRWLIRSDSEGRSGHPNQWPGCTSVLQGE